MYMESPPQRPATYSMAVWVGTPAGAGLSADANPNTTPPAAARILVLSGKRGNTVIMGQVNLMTLVYPVAGTPSGTFQPWFFDDTLGAWIQRGVAFTLSPVLGTSPSDGRLTATNLSQVVSGALTGSKWFVQLTSNTSSLITAFAYDFI